MTPGVAGVSVMTTDMHCGVEVPQEFSVWTQMSPPDVPKFTVIFGVPVPDASTAPGGRVQM